MKIKNHITRNIKQKNKSLENPGFYIGVTRLELAASTSLK